MAPKSNTGKNVAEKKKIVESDHEEEDEQEEDEIEVKKSKKQVDTEEEVESEEEEVEESSKSKKISDDESTGDEKKKRADIGPVSSTLIKRMKEMFKDELPDISQKDMKIVCDSFVKMIVSEVKEGKNITLMNHMTFKRVKRAERTHSIPKTNNKVVKPAHFVMTMEVKPALKKVFCDVDVDVDA